MPIATVVKKARIKSQCRIAGPLRGPAFCFSRNGLAQGAHIWHVSELFDLALDPELQVGE
jgi:hypothetical protein